MQIAKNIVTGWMVFVVRVSTTLVITPFILSSLGVADYGLWALVISLAALLELLDFGMSNGLRRYYSQAIGKKDQALMQNYLDAAASVFLALAVLVLIATVALVILGASIVDVPADRMTQFRIVMSLLGIRAAIVFALKPFGGVLAANERYDIIYLIQLAGSIVSALLVVVALVFGLGIVGLAIATLVSASAANVAEYIVAQNKFGPIRPKIRFHRSQFMSALLSYSGVTIIISLCDYAKGNLNNILVASLTDLESVVYYAIAFQLIGYLIQLLRVVTITYMPRISRLQGEGNYAELKRQVITGAKMSSAVLAFMLIMVWFCGNQFLQLWLDESFVLSYEILRVLIPAMALANSLSVLVSYLYATSKHHLYAKISVVEVVVDVAASVWLLQKIGVMGAAWGTFIAVVSIRYVAVLLTVCRELKISPIRMLVRGYGRVAAFGSVFVAAAVLLSSTNLALVESWFEIILYAGILGTVGSVIAWVMVLDSDGRASALMFARERLHRVSE